jgi:hypothetical protein
LRPRGFRRILCIEIRLYQVGCDYCEISVLGKRFFTFRPVILPCLAIGLCLVPAAELRSEGDASRNERSDGPDLSPAPVNEEREKLFQEKLGPTFRIRRTAHFAVFYDAGPEDLEFFGTAVERTYASCVRFVCRLGIDYSLPEEKLIAVFFNEKSEFREHLKLGPHQQYGGLYKHSTRAFYFYNQRNSPERNERREQAKARLQAAQERLNQGGLSPRDRRAVQREMNRARREINRLNTTGGSGSLSTLQHEVAHQVLFHIGFHNVRNYGANPTWFIEGMAHMFEPALAASGANIGRVNTEQLAAFRKLVQEDRLMPLRELIVASLESEGFRPQAWALTHYLTRMKRAELRVYVQLLLGRPAGYKSTPEAEIETFEQAFGPLDEAWERRWLAWMEKVSG